MSTAAPAADPVLRAENLGKTFKIYPTPWARAAEWGSLGRTKRHVDFPALSGVSFALARGESLGVIGVNGSGKSTLLKILSGALVPTAGTFAVRGRVLSLLELGTGVNPQLTGRQNVVTSSRLLDFPPGYAEGRLADIEAFADLPDGFFDRPVGLYSSGMLVRLVFATFACFDPDVFVVDEALSVGDVFFQQKCARRLQQMRAAGTTLLFVSHDLAAVEALCDRVLVLHKGTVRHDGDKKVGISLYYALGGAGAGGPTGVAGTPGEAGAGTDDGSIGPARDGVVREAAEGLEPAPALPPLSAAAVAALPWQVPDGRDGFGTGAMALDGVCFRRLDGSPEPVVRRGEWLEAFVRARAGPAGAAACNLGLAVYDRHDRLQFARGWVNAGLEPPDVSPGGWVVARFALKLDLEPGEYVVGLSAARAVPDPAAPAGWDQHVGGDRYHELPRAAKVAVLPPPTRARPSFGPANLRSRADGVVGREEEVPDAPAHRVRHFFPFPGRPRYNVPSRCPCPRPLPRPPPRSRRPRS